MRRIKYVFCLPVLFLLICFKGYSSNQKEVLVLNSYHSGLSWTDSIVSSIKQRFANDMMCNVYIEYMDTKRCFSEEYLEILQQYYKKKYRDKRFDIIISTDNNAYDFLLKYKLEIFGDTPVLFCGLNSIVDIPKGYSGVFENTNFHSTISLIEKNHPDFKELVVISDHSTTGKTVVDALKKNLSTTGKSVNYRILQPENIPNLQIRIAALQKGSIVLYLLFNRDANNNYFTYEKAFDEVYPYCSVPIYCVWDFYMNRGAVGGALITGYNQGKQVSIMAKKVLAGTPVDELPPLRAVYEYTFDHKQLSRFNINRKNLPDNSIIINSPFNFVKSNKEIVILTLTVLVLLTMIIIVMSINIHLRKLRAQKEKAYLKEIQANQQSLQIAKEKAEESNRLKSAFLANMSHEIRTPMNAILGFSDLLSANNLKKEKHIRFISIIQKNTKILLRLINDILDISKIETNQLKIIRTKCNLNDLFSNLKDSYDTLLEQNENREVKLIVSKPQNLDNIEILTDSMRLQQIFANLIENSIKFTNVGEIEIGYEIEDSNVLFFVKDSGIGISEDKQKIIFDRFRQAYLDVNTRKYGGTGLGLAISKSLVELLDGKIWMVSKLNEGTSFYFSIPY